MSEENFILYTKDDILKKKEIKRHNAFIRKDGTFYLADGYRGGNPSYQLDNSAMKVGRKDIGHSFIDEYYENYLQFEPTLLLHDDKTIKEFAMGLVEYESSIKYFIKNRQERVLQKIALQKVRSILVHYYGYVLFAKIEKLNSEGKIDFYDESIFPNPEYYGQIATVEQIATFEEIFKLNSSDRAGKYYQDEDYVKRKLLLIENHLTSSYNWHC